MIEAVLKELKQEDATEPLAMLACAKIGVKSHDPNPPAYSSELGILVVLVPIRDCPPCNSRILGISTWCCTRCWILVGGLGRICLLFCQERSLSMAIPSLPADLVAIGYVRTDSVFTRVPAMV